MEWYSGKYLVKPMGVFKWDNSLPMFHFRMYQIIKAADQLLALCSVDAVKGRVSGLLNFLAWLSRVGE